MKNLTIVSSVGLGWIFERGSIGSTSCSQPSWHVQPFWGCLGTILGALGLGILLGNLGLQCIIFFFGSWRSFWTLCLSGDLGTFLEAHGLGFLFGNLSLRGTRLLCSLFLDLGLRGIRLLCSLFWILVFLAVILDSWSFWGSRHFFGGSRPRHSFGESQLSGQESFFLFWPSWRSFLEALGLGILFGDRISAFRRLCSLCLDLGLLGGHFWLLAFLGLLAF